MIPTSFSPIRLFGASEAPDWVPSTRGSSATRQYVTCLQARKAIALRVLSLGVARFKICVEAGGVNAASADRPGVQDYFIAPDQQWIFGVRVADGLARQFQILKAESRDFSLGMLVHGTSRTNYIEIRIFTEKTIELRFSPSPPPPRIVVDSFVPDISTATAQQSEFRAAEADAKGADMAEVTLQRSTSTLKKGKRKSGKKEVSWTEPAEPSAHFAADEPQSSPFPQEQQASSHVAGPPTLFEDVVPPDHPLPAIDAPAADTMHWHQDFGTTRKKGKKSKKRLSVVFAEPWILVETAVVSVPMLPETQQAAPDTVDAAVAEEFQQDELAYGVSSKSKKGKKKKESSFLAYESSEPAEIPTEVFEPMLPETLQEAPDTVDAFAAEPAEPTAMEGMDSDPTELPLSYSLKRGKRDKKKGRRCIVDDEPWPSAEESTVLLSEPMVPETSLEATEPAPAEAVDTAAAEEVLQQSEDLWTMSSKKRKKDKKKKKSRVVDSEPCSDVATSCIEESAVLMPSETPDEGPNTADTITAEATEPVPVETVESVPTEEAAAEDVWAMPSKNSKKNKKRKKNDVDLDGGPVLPPAETVSFEQGPEQDVASDTWPSAPKPAPRSLSDGHEPLRRAHPEHEMTIGTGGLVKQTIVKDDTPERWEEYPFQTVRIYIVDPDQFEADTGLNIAPSNIIRAGSIGVPAPRTGPIVRDPEGLDPRLPSFAALIQLRPVHASPLARPVDEPNNPVAALASVPAHGPADNAALAGNSDGQTSSKVRTEALVIGGNDVTSSVTNGKITGGASYVLLPKPKPFWKKMLCCYH